MYWIGCQRKQSWPNLRYHHGICMERLSKITKKVIQDRQCSCRNSTRYLSNIRQKRCDLSQLARSFLVLGDCYNKNLNLSKLNIILDLSIDASQIRILGNNLEFHLNDVWVCPRAIVDITVKQEMQCSTNIFKMHLLLFHIPDWTWWSFITEQIYWCKLITLLQMSMLRSREYLPLQFIKDWPHLEMFQIKLCILPRFTFYEMS
jgi:hypothetical protein